QAPVTVGAGEKLTVAVTAEPDGALGVYNVYVTAASGAANTATFQTQFVGLSVELDAVTTTGALAPTQSSAVQDNGYDGFLTVQSGPESGYFKNINSTLNASDPGDEFQQAFLSLYQSVKADPDHIWVDGATAKNLGSLLKTASSSSYQLKLDGDGHGHFLGAVVTGTEHQVTRKLVPFKVHPWMLPGCALIRSETLPVPDSHISATAEVISVQEY